MIIAGIQKLSLLDYPDHVAATVFTYGCNFRCPFCHNPGLVTGPLDESVDESELFEFLESRIGLLDGICITGGEPTLQNDLEDFCLRVKKMGFLVKLDTNGCSPEKLEHLLETNAIDYAAIDLKNTEQKYCASCGISNNPYPRVLESIELLERHGFPYELRTTVVKELHSEDDLIELASVVPKTCKWFLQSFQDGPNILGGTGMFHPWDEHDLYTLAARLQESSPLVQIRGEN